VSQRAFIALGTGSQVPTRKRNHNGYFLRWDGAGLLFDPGEGTQRQMTLAGVAASEITQILITHFHGDHCLGLAGVIQRLSLDGVTRPVQILFPASGRRYLENLRHASIFHDRTDLELIPIEEPGMVWRCPNFSLSALPLDHTVEAWGYRLTEPDDWTLQPEKLAELGIEGAAIGRLKRDQRLETENGLITLEDVARERPGQQFAFVMDTRFCENAIRLARNTDMVVCEATYLEREAALATEYGPLTAAQAAEIARRAEAGLLVLTHFSTRYTDLDDHRAEAAAIHPQVVIVEDGQTVDVPKRSRPLG